MEQQNSSTKSNRGTRILVVGLCCIDEIDYVDKFPAEDSDTRIFEQTLSLGGNAANSVTVLSQLNTNCELFASIPANNSTLESLIKPTRICIQNCVRRPGTDIPKSTVILNRINGSRTVLHYRGSIPELTAEEFIEIFDDKLDNYSWIHFEGRNCDEIKK
uniref:Carbohydrate kinase PfkB domain-containing protein n=1 Tax=Ditylenchus dipsaci TaxID=166011 RepID=A0A915DNZ0_9BILA